jgi:hypothetical protein
MKARAFICAGICLAVAGLTRRKSTLDIRLELLPAATVRIPDPKAAGIKFPGVAFTDFSYAVYCFDTPAVKR